MDTAMSEQEEFQLSRFDDIKVKLGSTYGAAAVKAADIYWLAAQVQNLKQWKEVIEQQCNLYDIPFDTHQPRITLDKLLQVQFEMGSTSHQMELPFASESETSYLA